MGAKSVEIEENREIEEIEDTHCFCIFDGCPQSRPQSREGIAELVLDFDGLDYVSSVGLRVILNAQQKMRAAHGSMVVKNVSQTIASVFEMTGFDSILTYEKNRGRIVDIHFLGHG